ncbi:hypothetical protein [Mycolicibacterium sp. XJ775]
MSDVVERAKAAQDGVTDGPWEVNSEGWACISSGSDSVLHGHFDGCCPSCGEVMTEDANVVVGIEDAEFIVQARTLVPELVAEVERLRAVVERVRHLARNPGTVSGTQVVTVTPRRILAVLEALS